MEGRLLRWAKSLGDGETIAALGDLTAGIGEAQMDGWIEEGRVWTWRAGDPRKDGCWDERRGEEDVGMDGRGWDVAEGAWFE